MNGSVAEEIPLINDLIHALATFVVIAYENPNLKAGAFDSLRDRHASRLL